ncbi:unnamed protein product [Moneuplotes crassus]|uniref:Peroxisomal membrane protein PEX16 n=1 Tax=Euplotes crassus TaxID=5936 RepID=A0AAD1XF05_EUPCR|nr:unnamed protein product [Moneuplotes crassus]
MSVSTQRGSGSKLHLGLYAFQLIGEVNTIRKQIFSKESKLVYLSSTLSQIEMLCELTFAHLNETVEPLIYFFEAVKALLKLKEYVGLITKERIGYYISKELYEVYKTDEEKMKSIVMLPRSKKKLPKPDKFQISNKMLKFALKSAQSVDSLASLEDDQHQKLSRNMDKPIIREILREDHIQRKGFFSKVIHFFLKRFKYLLKVLGSRKFKIVEILLILRPVIYMYLYLKHGAESYKPFSASLLIEIFGIIYCIQKSSNCRTETEQQELTGRWKGLFKYALKEPFFSKYTVNIVQFLLRRFISQGKIAFVLSILTYFKYYCYIV